MDNRIVPVQTLSLALSVPLALAMRGLRGEGILFPMSQTIYKMAGSKDPFARIPHTMLEDDRLSWKAKGILAYLCGKPNGWKMRVSDIANHGTEGKHAIRAALNELRDAGYAEFHQSREHGIFKEGCGKVSDTPIF